MASSKVGSGIVGTVAVWAVTILLAIAALGLIPLILFAVWWIGEPFLGASAPREARFFVLLMAVVDAALWACAIGLPLGRAWAWTGAVILGFLGMGASLFSRLPDSAWLYGLVLSAGAVVALFLPSTRARFGA